MRLIDADALMQKISKMLDYCQDNDFEAEMSALFQVGDAVIDCPTIEAEPVKHGRWEYAPDYAEYCSVCGSFPDEEVNHHYNCCPNCGAKMDLEEI